MDKIEIFAKYPNFGKKSKFWKKSKYSTNIQILAKHPIFGQNRNIRQISKFRQNIQFLDKIEIFAKYPNFGHTNRMFCHRSKFWPKIKCWTISFLTLEVTPNECFYFPRNSRLFANSLLLYLSANESLGGFFKFKKFTTCVLNFKILENSKKFSKIFEIVLYFLNFKTQSKFLNDIVDGIWRCLF